MAFHAQMLLLQRRPPYLCQRKVLRPPADSSPVCTVCPVGNRVDGWRPAAEQDTLGTAAGQARHSLEQRCILYRCNWSRAFNMICCRLLGWVNTFGSGYRLLYWRRSSADPKRSPDSRRVLRRDGRRTPSTDERLACWGWTVAVHSNRSIIFLTF